MTDREFVKMIEQMVEDFQCIDEDKQAEFKTGKLLDMYLKMQREKEEEEK